MLVVLRTEDPADSVGQLMSAERPLGLDHFAFGVDPLGLYRIEPRALRRQQAGHYSYSGFATAIFDLTPHGCGRRSSRVPDGSCASLRCPRSGAEPSCLSPRACGSTSKGTAWLWRSPAYHPRTSATSPQALAGKARSRRGP